MLARDQRLSRAEGPARCCARWVTEVRADLVTNIVQPGRFIAIERGLDLPHPRAAAERPAARHLHRRPPRPEGAHHHPRRTRRDRRRTTAAPSCCWRTAASSGTRRQAARSDHRAVRPLRVRPVAVLRRRPGRQLFGARALSLGTARARSQRSALQASSRASSAPSCTTACWRRSIRSPSCVIAFAFLGAPRTTRQSRGLVDDRRRSGASPALRLIGFASTVFARALSDRRRCSSMSP